VIKKGYELDGVRSVHGKIHTKFWFEILEDLLSCNFRLWTGFTHLVVGRF